MKFENIYQKKSDFNSLIKKLDAIVIKIWENSRKRSITKCFVFLSLLFMLPKHSFLSNTVYL